MAARAFDVPVDAARRDEHGCACDLEGLAAGLDGAPQARDLACAPDERVDPVAEAQVEQVAARVIEQAADEAIGQRAARAPDDVEPRHRVAG